MHPSCIQPLSQFQATIYHPNAVMQGTAIIHSDGSDETSSSPPPFRRRDSESTGTEYGSYANSAQKPLPPASSPPFR